MKNTTIIGGLLGTLVLLGCWAGCTPTTKVNALDTLTETREKKLLASIDASFMTGHKAEMDALERQTALLGAIKEQIDALHQGSAGAAETPAETPGQDPPSDEVIDPPADQETEQPLEVEPPATTKSTVEIEGNIDFPIPKAEEVNWPAGVRLVYFYGDPCPHCEKMLPVLDTLKQKGVSVTKILAWYVNPAQQTVYTQEGDRWGVRRVPALWFVVNDLTVEKETGYLSLDEVVSMAREHAPGYMSTDQETTYSIPPGTVDQQPKTFLSIDAKPTQTRPSIVRLSGANWNVNGTYTPTMTQLSNHLVSHGLDPSGLTYSEMMDLHNNDHNGYRIPDCYKIQSTQAVTYRQPQTVTYRQPQTVYYSSKRSSKQSGGRMFGMFNSSCPGGTCP